MRPIERNQALRVYHRRSVLSRLTLTVGLLASVATSAPPRWELAAQDQRALSKQQISSRRHRVANVHFHITAPKGIWSMNIGLGYATDSPTHASLWLQGGDWYTSAWSVSWAQSCGNITCAPPQDEYESSAYSETACTPDITTCQAPWLTVECTTKRCVIDFDLELHARADGYVPVPIEDVALVEASMSGDVHDDRGCSDDSDSSDGPPAGLSIQIEIGRFKGDPNDLSIIDREANDGVDGWSDAGIAPDGGADAATRLEAGIDAGEHLRDSAVRQ